MQINWYIDFTGAGFVKVPPPKNWKELQLELLFVNDRPDMPYKEFPSATVSAMNFEWVGQNAIDINKYIAGGLTGATPGIFEALPVRIELCKGPFGQVVTLDKYGINLAEDGVQFECDKVVAPLVKLGEIDFINAIADTVSFSHLASALYGGPTNGKITFADYTKTPYCINTIPNWTQVAVLSMAVFLLYKELREAIVTITKDINQLLADIASATLSWGNVFIIACDILTILLHIAYFALILVALVNMIGDIINNIWQPTKYKLGMTVETLMRKAAASVGLNFASSVLVGSKLTIIPQKYIMPNPGNPLYAFIRSADEVNNNGKHYGYPDCTWKQLITDMQDLLNCAGKVIGNTFYFESVDFWNKQNAFKLPNTGTPGFHANLPAPNGTNASKLAMNYVLQYQLDSQDLNTYDNYSGTIVQVSMVPKKTINPVNQLNKGLTRIQFNYAQATRKDHMSVVEHALNVTIGALNGVIGFIIQGITNLVSYASGNPPAISNLLLIGNTRVGYMELTSDYIGVQKVFYGSGTQSDWRIDPTSRARLAASALMQNNHGVNLATRGNQYLLYVNKKIPLCCADFLILSTNNILTTADNKKGKFSKIVWNPHKETATVDYGIKQNYTNNLTETISEDGN